MKLTLVKQGNFLGTKCDFYRDENGQIFMSRTQIGYALQYSNPQKAISNIHDRNKERLDKLSIQVTAKDFRKTPQNEVAYPNMKPPQNDPPYTLNKNPNALNYMYTEKGIYDIVRKSRQPIADDFYDWVYDVIQAIKENGYYLATEKDERWLGIRQEGKDTRREETDAIKEFVEYAKEQGSNKPQWYYKHFTNLVRTKLNIPKNLDREDMNQKMLMQINILEGVITMKLPKLIKTGMGYKDIYEKIKELIHEI